MSAPPRITIAPAPRMPVVIDRGLKEVAQYEYKPSFSWSGLCVPSIDIGKVHFATHVEGLQPERTLYSGLWKVGDTFTVAAQKRLTSLLEQLDPYFQKAKVALVERQRSQNHHIIIRIEQHVLSFLELRYPHLDVINIPSNIKYTKLNGPSGESDTVRKRWAVEEATRCFAERYDPAAKFVQQLHALRNDKEAKLKADDVGDAYLQYKAWLTTLKPGQRLKWLH